MTERRLLICAEETATLLGLKKDQIYAMARCGILPHVRVGRKVMFSPKALEVWIDNGGTALPGVWRKAVNSWRAAVPGSD